MIYMIVLYAKLCISHIFIFKKYWGFENIYTQIKAFYAYIVIVILLFYSFNTKMV